MRTLSPAEKKMGILSASTGNHGLGTNHAARLEDLDLVLYVPENASPEKIDRLRKAGAKLNLFGASCEKAEIQARREAEASGKIYISPYNDLEIIYGQGTIGIEILEELPDVEDVLVPVGGGGLVAGIAGYLKSRNPGLGVFGVEPAHSAFMKASLEAGRLIDIEEKETLADAVAGGIEPESVTFPLCREFVDDLLTVDEEHIKKSLQTIYEAHHEIVEGAGALALAALMKYQEKFRGRKALLIVSGGNISQALFQRITGSNIKV